MTVFHKTAELKVGDRVVITDEPGRGEWEVSSGPIDNQYAPEPQYKLRHTQSGHEEGPFDESELQKVSSKLAYNVGDRVKYIYRNRDQEGTINRIDPDYTYIDSMEGVEHRVRPEQIEALAAKKQADHFDPGEEVMAPCPQTGRMAPGVVDESAMTDLGEVYQVHFTNSGLTDWVPADEIEPAGYGGEQGGQSGMDYGPSMEPEPGSEFYQAVDWRGAKRTYTAKFEGWSDEQARKTWNSLGGSHGSCVKKVKGVSDPDAYCAALKDRVTGTTKWRGKGKGGGIRLTAAQVRDYCPACADEMKRQGIESIPVKLVYAAKFDSWSDERARKQWNSLGGSEHACASKMEGKVDNPDAYCSALKDRVTGTTKWRGKGKGSAKTAQTESEAEELWDALVQEGVLVEQVLPEPDGTYSVAVSDTGDLDAAKRKLPALGYVVVDEDDYMGTPFVKVRKGSLGKGAPVFVDPESGEMSGPGADEVEDAKKEESGQETPHIMGGGGGASAQSTASTTEADYIGERMNEEFRLGPQGAGKEMQEFRERTQAGEDPQMVYEELRDRLFGLNAQAFNSLVQDIAPQVTLSAFSRASLVDEVSEFVRQNPGITEQELRSWTGDIRAQQLPETVARMKELGLLQEAPGGGLTVTSRRVKPLDGIDDFLPKQAGPVSEHADEVLQMIDEQIQSNAIPESPGQTHEDQVYMTMDWIDESDLENTLKYLEDTGAIEKDNMGYIKRAAKKQAGLEKHIDNILEPAGFRRGEDYNFDMGKMLVHPDKAHDIAAALNASGEIGQATPGRDIGPMYPNGPMWQLLDIGEFESRGAKQAGPFGGGRDIYGPPPMDEAVQYAVNLIRNEMRPDEEAIQEAANKFNLDASQSFDLLNAVTDAKTRPLLVGSLDRYFAGIDDFISTAEDKTVGEEREDDKEDQQETPDEAFPKTAARVTREQIIRALEEMGATGDLDKAVWEGDPYGWTSGDALFTISTEYGLPPGDELDWWMGVDEKVPGAFFEPVNSAVMAVWPE